MHPSEIINDIRSILDLGPEGGGGDGGSGATGAAAALAPAASGGAEGGAGGASGNSNELSANHKPKIIWKSDSNTLYVVATRLQHMWVEGYLAAADKKQSLIAIEVKFIETSNDPKREFGVDWTGTFGEGSTFRQVQDYDTSQVDANGNPVVEVKVQ